MQHLSSVNKIEYFLDEVVQEDCLTETEAEISDLGGEWGEAGEVSELGAVAEVQQEVGQVGAPLGQLVEYIHRDEVARQFQVFKIDSKSTINPN